MYIAVFHFPQLDKYVVQPVVHSTEYDLSDSRGLNFYGCGNREPVSTNGFESASCDTSRKLAKTTALLLF